MTWELIGWVLLVALACWVGGYGAWWWLSEAVKRDRQAAREISASGVRVRVTCGELTAETIRRVAREFSQQMEHQIKHAEESMRRPTFCHGTQEVFEAMQHQVPDVTLTSLGEFQEEGGRA